MGNLAEVLDGFDVQDALERFSGCEDILLKYVRLMILDFHARLPQARSLLLAGAFNEAAACLHSLAGTAAALSASRLFDSCHAGERCMRSRLVREALLHIEWIDSFISSLELTLQPHLKNGGTL